MRDPAKERGTRPRVLTFVKHYLPGYRMGGPTRTISNMVERLGEDFDFHIVTSDRDMGSTQRYESITDEPWQTVQKARVHYVAPRRATFRYLVNLVRATSPDIIYLNSFFDPFFTQKILVARRLYLNKDIPVILAPRGEFSPGALHLKRLKKSLYMKLALRAGLYRGLTWHASSEREMRDIRGRLSAVTLNPGIHIARNLAALPRSRTVTNPALERGPRDALDVCFLSRISRMKNLDFALRVLSKVQCPVNFTIYGPREDPDYWEECQQLVAQLPTHISVKPRGLVPHDLVQDTLSAHDLFFLPTRGENYGHVIHEALAAGLPVLISDQTPWNELSKEGVGWALPLDDMAGFACILEQLATWDDARLHAVRGRATAYATRESEEPTVLHSNTDLFGNALSAGSGGSGRCGTR